MWSTERMDPNSLHQEAIQKLSNFTSHDLHFSFNFGLFRKDPRFINNKESYKNKHNKAKIIEAKCEEKEEIWQNIWYIQQHQDTWNKHENDSNTQQ